MELIELSRKNICDAKTDGAAEGLAKTWRRLNSSLPSEVAKGASVTARLGPAQFVRSIAS